MTSSLKFPAKKCVVLFDSRRPSFLKLLARRGTMEAKSQYASGTKRRFKSQGRKMVKVRRSAASSSSMPLGRSKEIKSVDIEQSLTFPLNTAVQGIALNDTSAGADYFNRIGRKVTGVSLRVRGRIDSPNVVAANIDIEYLRFMIVHDKQPVAGVVASWADVVLAQSAAGGTASGALSGLNMNHRDRFKILREYTLNVPQISAVNTANGPWFPTSSETLVDMFVKVPFETIYGGSATSNITSGQIFIIGQSISGLGYFLTFSCRYRFAE